MNAWERGERPLTLAILAMGGEGGGVLADWVVAVAENAGVFAQNTSVAGVAQRTGATIYYVELAPPAPGAVPAGGRPEPVLSMFPAPGEVDVVIASELMEAGRAVQRGFVTPERTTLIASTNRVYAMSERTSLGDGRVDADRLLASAERAARRLVAADFMAIADEARTVISAALLGALAGSGALPFTREQFEAVIEGSSGAAQRSRAAFAAGFAAAQQPGPVAAESSVASSEPAVDPAPRTAPVPISIGRRPRSPEEDKQAEERRRLAVAAERPESLVGPALAERAARVARDFPPAARSMLLHGLERTALYQDLPYADRYLDRVARVTAHERDPHGDAVLTTEAARHVALWMCYHDTIHVALQKTRQGRLSRVRSEARAEDDQLIQVREYLHPQIDEITDTLPTALGRRLAASKPFQKAVTAVTRDGLVINTTSLVGYTALSTLARLRPIRPRSLRFGREQAYVDGWLDAVVARASDDYALACEMVTCARVLKGYGQTHQHGSESFAVLMRAAEQLAGRADAAERLARLQSAALADEDGKALAAEAALVG